MDIDKLTASIKSHEGYNSFPYEDTTGHITIGFGRNLTGEGISNEEGEYLLQNDINRAISEAESQSWWPAVSTSDPRTRAFVEIVFNIGLGKLAGFSHALEAAMQSDWVACASAFRDSLWFRQVGNRAVTLCNMIETGQDATPPSQALSQTSV